MKYFPPMPLPRERSKKIAKSLAFIGYQITKLDPNLAVSISQTEIDTEPEVYASLAILSALFQGFVLFLVLSLILYISKRWELLTSVVFFSAFLAAFMFIRIMAYPAFIVRKRVNEIERNFLYALRHLLIQIRGGSPVFNSLVSVSEGGYGSVSDEFRRVVKDVHAGKPLTEALEDMAMRNPSIYLRRTIWQMVNALRTGINMGETLKVIVDQFTAEQRVLLEKFGKELSPWAMMYMMITVIFPTLGITIFLIVSSLTPVRINETMLFGFVLISGVVQYFFMQFLKTKRPPMRW